MKHTYQGKIRLGDYGDDYDALMLSGEPLAVELRDTIGSTVVTARYWITDREVSREEAEESAVRTVMGDMEVEYWSHYSEITGYLWTDEEINIGGHDLLAELSGYVGKWLILEVEVHDQNQEEE